MRTLDFLAERRSTNKTEKKKNFIQRKGPLFQCLISKKNVPVPAIPKTTGSTQPPLILYFIKNLKTTFNSQTYHDMHIIN